MNTTRRGFLGLLGAAAAACVVLPKVMKGEVEAVSDLSLSAGSKPRLGSSYPRVTAADSQWASDELARQYRMILVRKYEKRVFDTLLKANRSIAV